MIRLQRMFAHDGKTVIVAIDHGMGLHVNPELDSTATILEQVVAGGADGVLVTYGMAREYASLLRDVAVIVRVDGGGSQIGTAKHGPSLLFSIEDALKVGADAVVCMGFPGHQDEFQTMGNLSTLVAQGNQWGVPVVAEMLPGGFGESPPKSVENIRLAVRTGCEYGADIIKTSYVGPPEEFKKVIDASYKPVIVLGGEKTYDLDGMMRCIEEAISVGASGVAIGRNVWKHANPKRITEVLVELVHHGRSYSEIEF